MDTKSSSSTKINLLDYLIMLLEQKVGHLNDLAVSLVTEKAVQMFTCH